MIIEHTELCLFGASVVAQWVKNPASIHEDAGSIPGLSGLRIWRCCELSHRSRIRLGSGVAKA